jgi:hypothetical protein
VEDVERYGSFLDGGANPGIVESDDGYEDDDLKWRESVILHELDRQESSSSGAVGGGGGVEGVDAAPPSSSSSSSPSPR